MQNNPLVLNMKSFQIMFTSCLKHCIESKHLEHSMIDLRYFFWKMVFQWEKQTLHFSLSINLKIYTLSKLMLMILFLILLMSSCVKSKEFAMNMM